MDTASPRPGLVDLAHADAADATLTGAKAANLAIAQRAGLPVLPGNAALLAVLDNGRRHRRPHPQQPGGPRVDASPGGPDPALSTIDVHSTAAPAGASSPGTGRSAGIGTGAAAAAPVAPVPDPDGDAVVREALRLRLVGCLEDATLDRVMGHVQSITTDA